MIEIANQGQKEMVAEKTKELIRQLNEQIEIAGTLNLRINVYQYFSFMGKSREVSVSIYEDIKY